MIGLFLVAAGPSSASAQAPASTRLDTVRGSAGFSGSSTSSDDFASQLGLLEVEVLGEKPNPQPWTATVGATGFYTNNATLNGISKEEDYFVAASAMMAFQPQITDNVAGLFAVRQDVFRYDRMDALDFEYLEASAGASFRIPGVPNTVATLRYVYTRLDSDNWDSTFYQDHGIAAGLATKWRYSESFGFVAGLNAQVSLDPHPNAGRRDDYSAYAAIIFQPVEKLQFTAGYVGSYFSYGFAGRDDINQLFRVGAVYRPISWLWVGASAAYALNHSSLDAFDYGAWTVGVGAGVELHF